MMVGQKVVIKNPTITEEGKVYEVVSRTPGGWCTVVYRHKKFLIHEKDLKVFLA
jgi:hypothetical protein